MPEATQKFRIGRDDACDLVLKDRSISRRHADLMIEPNGGVEILDRESSGGTFLLREGKAHSISRARLRPTDSVRFGEYEISVKDLLAKLGQLPARAPRKSSTPPPPLPVKATITTPTPRPAPAAVSASAGRMVRCECGTVKKRGVPCPSCGS